MKGKPTGDDFEEWREGHFTYRRAKPKTNKEEVHMTPRTANIALEFLKRVNLNSEEIDAFMLVKRELEEYTREDYPTQEEIDEKLGLSQ